MIVRVGWNSQFARRKFDIELDETDLAALIREAGLPYDETLPLMTAPSKYAILKNEAELLSLDGAISAGVFASDEISGAQAKLNGLRATRQTYLDQMKAFYAPQLAGPQVDGT